MMQLTLVLLKGYQTYLIAQSDQLELEPRCHLFEPMLVGGTSKVTLTPCPCILMRSTFSYTLIHYSL